MKAFYKKPRAIVSLTSGVFPLKAITRQAGQLWLPEFKFTQEIPANALRKKEEKGRKCVRFGK